MSIEYRGDPYKATITQQIAIDPAVAELLVGREDDDSVEWIDELQEALAGTSPANYKIVKRKVTVA